LALKLMHILSPEQGDQILYFGQSKLQTGWPDSLLWVVEITKVSHIFGHFFSTVKVLIMTNKVLGYILADIFSKKLIWSHWSDSQNSVTKLPSKYVHSIWFRFKTLKRKFFRHFIVLL
jgi:hypothetical protein